MENWTIYLFLWNALYVSKLRLHVTCCPQVCTDTISRAGGPFSLENVLSELWITGKWIDRYLRRIFHFMATFNCQQVFAVNLMVRSAAIVLTFTVTGGFSQGKASCPVLFLCSLEVHTENFLCEAAEGPQRLYVY